MWWYRLRGWKILGENVWAGGNELDLIVRRGRTLRFVEVKAKKGSRVVVEPCSARDRRCVSTACLVSPSALRV